MSSEKKSPKRRNRRRRRSRYRRKSTPARSEPQTQENSDAENEETNEGTEGTKGAVGDNMGEKGQAIVLNGHDDVLLTDGKECQSKDLDLDSVKTLRFVPNFFCTCKRMINKVDIH